MASIFGTLKTDILKAVTPITDRLRAEFGIKVPEQDAPAQPTIPQPPTISSHPLPPETPLTNALHEKYGVPTPTPYANDVSALATARAAAIPQDTFAKNLGDIGAGFLHKAAMTTEEFATNQAKNVEDFVTGKRAITPAVVGNGLLNLGEGALHLTGSIAQGFAQGILRIGQSLESALPGGKEALGAPQTDASGKLMENLTGSKLNPETYQNIFQGVDKWSVDKGATPAEAKIAAGFAVLGQLFVDEPGVGSGGKAVFNVGKDAIEHIARTQDENLIKEIIKKKNPGIPDATVDFIAPLFKDANTPEDVNRVVRLVQSSQKTALSNAEKKGIVEQAKRGEIAPELQPLAEEAKKYGSADEFLGSQNPIYRGATPDKFFEDKGRGLSFSTDKDVAQRFAEKDFNGFQKNGGVVEERFISPEAKILDSSAITAEKIKGDLTRENIFKYAKENGYDAIDFSKTADEAIIKSGAKPEKELRVINPEILKTKSELTDLYNQATKEVPLSVPAKTIAPANANLVKQLGESKNPYQVLNIVKDEFPNLPDRVVDRMVERFIRTKRIATVENLIKAAKNLDDRFLTGEIKAGPRIEETFGRELTPKEQVAAALKRGAEERVANTPEGIIEKTVPEVARKYMRLDQKIAYIDAIKNKFDDPKTAVAAANEYDRIWDDLNQHVVDEYEQNSMQKSFLEDTLANDPASQLYDKYYKRTKKDPSDPTEALHDLMNRAQAKANTVGKRGGRPALSTVESNARRLDAEIHELGYEDFEDAQAAVERYVQMQNEADRIGNVLKDLKPRVREARILQEGLADIAIIPPKEVQTIDRLITPANFRDYFNDIHGFTGRWRDLYRNFEAFFGDKYGEIKKAVLDKFDDAKGRFVDTNKQLGDDLAQNVVEKFGFKRGSKESAAIQRYGDTGLPEGERWNYQKLVEEFGKEKADHIVESDAWFRKTYDRLIDELNEVRQKIYPNSPGKLIAKRKDYYRHFRELSDTWGDALREFFETPSGIDPKLAGLSEFTKAKTRFLPFAEERKGQETIIDAIGGFLDYAPAFAYAKDIDPQVSVFRYLHRKIAEVAPKAGEDVKLPGGNVIKSPGAEGFLGFLDSFAKDLTGNTNAADRLTQYTLGRRTIRAARFLNNRMKANTVAGNIGSAIAQIANVPMGLADTKLYAGKGLQRSLASVVVPNEPMEKSIFLKERYADSLNERFPVQFKDRPFKATGDFAKKQAGWIMRKADEIGTKFIWNSEYEKALGKKIEDPIRYADDKTRRIVAGRGIGEVPLGQKALRTQFVAPFTHEVNNAWWKMKDWMNEGDYTAFATFFLANYVLNEIAEKVRGSRIVFDPVNATIDGIQALSQEYKEGNYVRGTLKLLGREAGEVLSNVGFGQTLAAILPDSAIQTATQFATGAPMTKQEIFGSSNISGRYGTPLLLNALNVKDALFRLLPPVGGLQLEKSYQGIRALMKGHAEDSKGNSTFDIPFSPQNIVRALAFGANATSESRKFFDSRQDLFDRIDRQSSETFVRQSAAEADWEKMKELVKDKKNKDAGALLRDISKKDPLEAKAIMQVAKDEKAGLSANDRLIKMLNVNNGERAKYIVKQLKSMKSNKERGKYLSDLAKKKIFTNAVAKQLGVLYKP